MYPDAGGSPDRSEGRANRVAGRRKLSTMKKCCGWVCLTLVIVLLSNMFAGYVRLSFLANRDISGLVESLDDRSEAVRKISVNRLANAGILAISPLADALMHNSPARREGAAIALGRMALQAPDVIPSLQERAAPALNSALSDEDSRVRVWAAVALWRVNRKTKEVMPILVQSWRDEDLNVRYAASQCLADIGPDAKEALPDLRKDLSNQDPSVRKWAADTLRRIEPELATEQPK